MIFGERRRLISKPTFTKPYTASMMAWSNAFGK